jgi:hypothetical protein
MSASVTNSFVAHSSWVWGGLFSEVFQAGDSQRDGLLTPVPPGARWLGFCMQRSTLTSYGGGRDVRYECSGGSPPACL